jgi:hypothetical protein
MTKIRLNKLRIPELVRAIFGAVTARDSVAFEEQVAYNYRPGGGR